MISHPDLRDLRSLIRGFAFAFLQYFYFVWALHQIYNYNSTYVISTIYTNTKIEVTIHEVKTEDVKTQDSRLKTNTMTIHEHNGKWALGTGDWGLGTYPYCTIGYCRLQGLPLSVVSAVMSVAGAMAHAVLLWGCGWCGSSLPDG